MAVGAIKIVFLVQIWKHGLLSGKREWIKTLVSGRASALFMTVWNAKEKEGFEIFKKYLSEKKQKQTYLNFRQFTSSVKQVVLKKISKE